MMRRAVPTVLAALLAAACTPNEPVRTSPASCDVVSAGDCTKASIERHSITDHPDKEYLLGVVEFDDQGKLYDDRQMRALFEAMKQISLFKDPAEAPSKQDVSIVVFVHGWKHNAKDQDGNILEFRQLLDRIARMEIERPRSILWPGAQWKPRKVIGVYAAWRGASLHATPVDENLTFWTRKAAAHRVAEGSIRELLARLKAFRDAIDATTWSGEPVRENTPDVRSSRMVTIGHSFGGLIVYSALAQYFVERAAASAVNAEIASATGASDQTGGAQTRIAGYGDLTVIVNPAIEAMRYEPLRHLVQDRGTTDYAPSQTPVLVEITSVGETVFEGDWATGLFFPIGRFFNTTFENFYDATPAESESRESRTALGHYAPFWTHHLSNPSGATKAKQPDPTKECNDYKRFISEFQDKDRPSGYLRSGWSRTYSNGLVLTHGAVDGVRSPFDPNNPFWVVKADPSVIPDHNDINEDVFVDFVRQLYDDLILAKEFKALTCKPYSPGG